MSQQLQQKEVFLRVRVGLSQVLMHPLQVDHVRSNDLLSLTSHLGVDLFGFGLVINLLLLFESLVGYVIQLLKMVFVMKIVAFLTHTDVLADRQLVASGRFHQ